MKNVIDLKSRYGDIHHLEKISDNEYEFIPAQQWMGIRLVGERDNLVMVDTDGGPALHNGMCIDTNIYITHMKHIDGKTIIEVKEGEDA